MMPPIVKTMPMIDSSPRRSSRKTQATTAPSTGAVVVMSNVRRGPMRTKPLTTASAPSQKPRIPDAPSHNQRTGSISVGNGWPSRNHCNTKITARPIGRLPRMTIEGPKRRPDRVKNVAVALKIIAATSAASSPGKYKWGCPFGTW